MARCRSNRTWMDARWAFLPGSWLAVPLAIAGGCGAPGPLFPEHDPPIVWPRGGDPPRFAYVGSIAGEADLKRPRSFWGTLVHLVSGGEPPRAMASAHGVAVSPSGVLYVSDPEAGTVHRFDLESREYRALEDAGSGRRFVTPIGLAAAAERLIVADRSLAALTVLSPTGDPEGVLGAGVLEAPVGVAVGPISGRYYVADVRAHQVKVFDPGGELVLAIGGRGSGEGEFNYPTHVACDARETIYVSDSLNWRIQVFDPTGRFLASWGEKGDTPGSFSQPKGIACDPGGRVYVVDSHFENVQVFSAAGELLLAIGQEGRGPGEFWLPVGVFAGRDGWIWVGDGFNRRVQAFRYVGEDAGDAG